MLTKELLNPESIVIVGGSNSTHKPGGKIVQNIIKGGFKGKIYIVNPKEKEVQGKKCYPAVEHIPDTDLAILAIAAPYCLPAVKLLATKKNTRAFIIISSGFSEEGKIGAKLEKDIVKVIKKYHACLIGPNCIGILNENYAGVFTSPVPKLDKKGCDFVSGSGATAVFILESAIPNGLTFASIFSVGNSVMVGVEEVLQFWDENYVENKSSKIKLLYIETIKNPQKFLHHASSLIHKGCSIAAIKSGRTEAGSRAASSHTGAMTSPDTAVDALFRKAGIVRCFGRQELITIASIYMCKKGAGKNILIITHAGGPSVMLTDVLCEGGLSVPKLKQKDALQLRQYLFPGASTTNPVDMMATGTAEQLANVIEYCDKKINYIDTMIVIFGSPGLTPVFDAYEVLHKKIHSCKKPIYPVLPSLLSAKEEVELFLSEGHINFPDEVVFGKALAKVYNVPSPVKESIDYKQIDSRKIKEIITHSGNGYLAPDKGINLIMAAGINHVKQYIVNDEKQALEVAHKTGYPLVMKVANLIHKSDSHGVALNISSNSELQAEYVRLSKINEHNGIIIQPMLKGKELFIGTTYEPPFGHIIVCGLGGIYVEIMNDMASGLAPISFQEALAMIRSLNSYKIFKGIRGQKGIPENKFAQCIVRLSTMLCVAPEIVEMDINPLMADEKEIVAVDVKICIRK